MAEPLIPRESLSDRELLLLVARGVDELTESVNGNGQPGLMTRVAKLEERTDKAPGPKQQTAINVGVVVAFATGLGAFVKSVMGL